MNEKDITKKCKTSNHKKMCTDIVLRRNDTHIIGAIYGNLSTVLLHSIKMA